MEEHNSLVITNWERARTQEKAKEQRQNLERSKGAKISREHNEKEDKEKNGGRKKRKLELPVIGEEWGSMPQLGAGRELGATLQIKEVPIDEGEHLALAGSRNDDKLPPKNIPRYQNTL